MPATQNLNSMLSPDPRRAKTEKSLAVSFSQNTIRSSPPHVRIAGASSRYQGGYLINI